MTSGVKSERIPRLVLDTSAYSRFRAGDTRVRDLIAANLDPAEETTERKNYKAEPAVETHSSLKKRAV